MQFAREQHQRAEQEKQRSIKERQEKLRREEEERIARIEEEKEKKQSALTEYRQSVLSMFFEAWEQVKLSRTWDATVELHDNNGDGLALGRSVAAGDTVAPLKQTAPDWRTAVLRVRIDPSGKVTRSFITSTSGYNIMDALVSKAAEKVPRLSAPPPEFLSNGCYELSIKFSLSGD